MILSETYKNRLKELAGIIQEKDNRSVIVNKIKLPQSVADWAHNLSEKHSIWIANTFKDFLYKRFKILGKNDPTLTDEIIKSFESGFYPKGFETEISDIKNSKEGAYRYVLDWLLRRQEIAPESDTIDFKNLTFDEALERTTKWHEEVAKLKGGQIEDEDGEVIMTFPDGFYWISLGKKYCKKEAEAMGHCATAVGKLYSLRKNKRPYVTADVDEYGVCYQIRASANTKPKQEYHKYILPFIFEFVNKFDYYSHRPQDQFRLSDLSKNDIKKIINDKPKLLEHEDLKKIGLSDEDIIYLINKEPTMLGEKQINDLLSPEAFEEFYKKHKDRFKSFVIKMEQEGYEGVKDAKVSFGKFTTKGVDIYYDDWSDSDLISLFDKEYQDFAKKICNNDLFLQYDYKFNDISYYNFDDVNEENLNAIRELLKEKLGERFPESATTHSEILNILDNDYEYDIDTENIKDAFVSAFENAQVNADEGEYWNLFINPIKKLLGKPEWIEQKHKSEDGKEKTKYFLKFTISYGEFLKYLKCYDYINGGYDYNNYTYFIDEYRLDITSVIANAVGECEDLNISEKLTINEPYYGVKGEIDKDDFNERLSEILSEV